MSADIMNVGGLENEGKSLNILNPYPVTMIRARIIVEGDVQQAGFRKNVWRVARKLGIKGLVENLKDGNVGITCEAEKDTIDNFIEGIKVIPLVEIENISIVGSDKATGEFEYFETIRGDMAEELGERLDTAVDVLYETKNELKDEMKKGFCAVKDEVKKVGEKVECVGEKVECVGEKVESMHGDMNIRFDKLDNTITEKFDRLDDKYHGMTDILNSINENQTNMQKEFIESRQELTKVVDKLVVIVDRFIEDEKNKESG